MLDRQRIIAAGERWAPWLAGALISLPVFLSYYPPMVDMPLHEAVVTLLKHWGNPVYDPPRVYELNLGLANQLFYFLILPLSFLVPIGVASKIIAGLAVLFFPLSVVRLADYLKVTRVAALTLAPIGLGWMFFWGLLGNMIGLNIYLWTLPSMDRFCQRPTGRGLAYACGLIVLLHYAHGLMALLAAGTLVFFTLLGLVRVTAWKEWRATSLLPLLPFCLAVALAGASWTLSAAVHSRFHDNFQGVAWMPAALKIDDAVDSLYTATNDPEWWMRWVIFFPCQVPVVIFAVERWLGRSRTKRTLREWIFDSRFELLGLIFLASYFVCPTQINGVTRLHPRFIHPAWVLLTLCACARLPSARRPWLAPRFLCLVVPLVPLLICWPQRFIDNDRTYRGLDEALKVVEPGSSYMVTHIGTVAPYQFDCLGVAGHVVGVLGGRTYFDYTQSEGSPIHQRVESQWNSIMQRVGLGNGNWMPAFDMKRYRYVLVHATNDPDLLDVGVRALQPEGRVIYHQGEWAVMQTTLDPVPLDAPDQQVTAPFPVTLATRFNLLSHGQGPAMETPGPQRILGN